MSEFKTAYLPSDYINRIDDEIRARTQGADETIREFEIALRTLMRRHGGFSEEKQVDILYRNLRPEYKSYIKKRDFANIAELISLGVEYELLNKEAKLFRPPPKLSQSFSTDTAYHGKFETKSVTHSSNSAELIDKGSGRGNYAEGPRYQTEDKNCWNCKGRGHVYNQCRRPRQKFCFGCGKINVTKRECENCRNPGNGRRVQRTGTPLDPSHATTSQP